MQQAEYFRPEQVKGSKELTYSLAVKKPFEVATQFYTTLFEPLTKGFVNEPFIIMPHITCVSPWPISILSTSIELVSSRYMYIVQLFLYRHDKVISEIRQTLFKEKIIQTMKSQF